MLARRGDLEALERLAAFDKGLHARARVEDARTRDGSALVRVRCGLRRQDGPAAPVARARDRLLWQPPAELDGLWDAGERDVTDALKARAKVVLRSQDDETEWVVPTATEATVPAAPDGEVVRVRVIAEATVDPAVAAAGAPLPPGRYGVRVSVSLAGFSAEAAAHVDGERFSVVVAPDGAATPSHRIEAATPDGLVARVTRPLRRRGAAGRG